MLVVRNVVESDMETLRKWRNNDIVRASSHSDQYITEESQKAWWNQVVDKDAYFIVEEDNKPIGTFSFKPGGPAMRLEWSFHINPELIGKGYGKKLCLEALKVAFENLNANKVVGEVLYNNKKSIGLHKSLGFTQEACFRQHTLKNDEYYDVLVFGLLKDEYKNG